MSSCTCEGGRLEGEPFNKDPDSTLDYAVDWTNWLDEGDTITESVWTVPAGLTEDHHDLDGAVATIWLTGGTLDAYYEVVNRITTAQGRTEDHTLPFVIESH